MNAAAAAADHHHTARSAASNRARSPLLCGVRGDVDVDPKPTLKPFASSPNSTPRTPPQTPPSPSSSSSSWSSLRLIIPNAAPPPPPRIILPSFLRWSFRQLIASVATSSACKNNGGAHDDTLSSVTNTFCAHATTPLPVGYLSALDAAFGERVAALGPEKHFYWFKKQHASTREWAEMGVYPRATWEHAFDERMG